MFISSSGKYSHKVISMCNIISLIQNCFLWLLIDMFIWWMEWQASSHRRSSLIVITMWQAQANWKTMLLKKGGPVLIETKPHSRPASTLKYSNFGVCEVYKASLFAGHGGIALANTRWWQTSRAHAVNHRLKRMPYEMFFLLPLSLVRKAHGSPGQIAEEWTINGNAWEQLYIQDQATWKLCRSVARSDAAEQRWRWKLREIRGEAEASLWRWSFVRIIPCNAGHFYLHFFFAPLLTFLTDNQCSNNKNTTNFTSGLLGNLRIIKQAECIHLLLRLWISAAPCNWSCKQCEHQHPYCFSLIKMTADERKFACALNGKERCGSLNDSVWWTEEPLTPGNGSLPRVPERNG